MRGGLALLTWLALALPTLAAETRLAARETLRVALPGAQAAFALDASIVEASVAAGDVVLFGRRAGRTLVTVVLPGSVETLAVHVEAGAPSPAEQSAALARERVGSAEVRYDSGSRRISTGIHARIEGQSHVSRVRVEGLHERRRNGGGSLGALPHASIEIESAARKVTLLDERIEGSPLGVDGVVVRGAHLRQGAWEVHAGLASATPYEDLFVPRDGDPIFSVTRRVRHGSFDLVPSFVYLPESAGESRAAVSLGLQGEAGPLGYKLEAGWGGRIGAAVDLRWLEPRRQAWIHAPVKPREYAAPALARSPGSRLDAGWTEQLGEATTVSASASANRLDLPGVMPQSTSARVDVRQQLAPGLALTGTASTGEYRSERSEATRRSTLGVGVTFDRPRFGASAQYRYQDVTGAGQAGHGGRLSLRANGGGLRANAFIDAQQQALTLDLLLRERSDLARALAELGIEASDPEALLRQLRDHAALLGPLGVTIGEVRLSPLRVQGGLDVSWRGTPSGPELFLRLLADQAESAGRERRSYVATAGASWRLRRNLEAGLAYSRWALTGDGMDGPARGALQVWVRFHFSDLALPGMGSAPISGRVLQEDAAEAGAPRPLAGVAIVLDGTRRTRTDADGRYDFERPGTGSHRIEAELPDTPGAYFLKPSSRMVKAGEEVSFAIAFSGGRLSGTVRDDAGTPLPGVSVRLEGPAPRTAVTDGAGRYRIAAPAGETRVAIAAESLPPGYEMGVLEPRHVRLAAGAPTVADFEVRAQRAIRGVVPEGSATVIARARGFEREVRSDAAGRFILRGVPAGVVALVIRSARGERELAVQVPAAAGVVDAVIPR